MAGKKEKRISSKDKGSQSLIRLANFDEYRVEWKKEVAEKWGEQIGGGRGPWWVDT